MSRLLQVVLLYCLAETAFAADRWTVQFFHDKDRSSLTINDLQFASATRGVAVGYLVEKRSVIPTAVVTSDAGKTWSFVTTKEVGISVFFLYTMRRVSCCLARTLWSRNAPQDICTC